MTCAMTMSASCALKLCTTCAGKLWCGEHGRFEDCGHGCHVPRASGVKGARATLAFLDEAFESDYARDVRDADLSDVLLDDVAVRGVDTTQRSALVGLDGEGQPIGVVQDVGP